MPRFPSCHDRHSTVVLNVVPSSRCRSARLAASLARCRECGARPARCQAGATRLAARHARDRDVLAGRRSRASLTQPAGMIAWRPPGWPPGSHAADSQRLSHLGHAAEQQIAGWYPASYPPSTCLLTRARSRCGRCWSSHRRPNPDAALRCQQDVRYPARGGCRA